MEDPIDNFTNIKLTDNKNNTLSFIDKTTGDPITTPVAGKLVSKTTNASGDILLVYSVGDPANNVCMPPNSRASFDIYTTVDPETTNGTAIAASVAIKQNDGAVEDLLLNNVDVTVTNSYLANVIIKKE